MKYLSLRNKDVAPGFEAILLNLHEMGRWGSQQDWQLLFCMLIAL